VKHTVLWFVITDGVIQIVDYSLTTASMHELNNNSIINNSNNNDNNNDNNNNDNNDNSNNNDNSIAVFVVIKRFWFCFGIAC
jgi:hypothetical protein